MQLALVLLPGSYTFCRQDKLNRLLLCLKCMYLSTLPSAKKDYGVWFKRNIVWLLFGIPVHMFRLLCDYYECHNFQD